MSTNITELLYNFAMNFFLKAPTVFSSAYIFIKTTNIKCSKSKLALLLTAFFVVNIISSVVLLFDNSLGCKRMQQNTDMVQSATPDGFVSESRRLDKSTDTTPLAYVVESLTRCSRILNLVQPSA